MTEDQKLKEWRDEYDANERQYEKMLREYDKELLDLQRAQFNLAKNTSRNTALTATIVTIMFILYIIGEVLSFLGMMATY